MRILKKILDILPVPFWVYFFSIVGGTIGILPHQSPAYDWTTKHVLPVAIILMLIGTPMTDLLKMGPKALKAMAIVTGTIFFAQVLTFVIMFRFLPEEGWKSVGALMGTWIGGSANMVAVKEILGLSDGGLSVLVIVDTLMSYSWMALLLSGAAFQKKFDAVIPAEVGIQVSNKEEMTGPPLSRGRRLLLIIPLLVVGFLIGECSLFAGKILSQQFPFLAANPWTLLVASTSAILLALTPLQKLKEWGAQTIGTYLLYLVLITIGAKTTMTATLGAPVYVIYGVLALAIHGVLSLLLGKYFRLPLYYLATASQANVGGAVSAPIVAEAYRHGTAHIGVLMAVLGAVLGTYLGVAGGYLCRTLGTWLQ